MQFEIYGEEEKEVVYLRLVYKRSSIVLVSCDKHGSIDDCGEILSISRHGQLIRPIGCETKGIQKDGSGRILEK